MKNVVSNDKFVKEFKSELVKKGLSDSVIEKHINNIKLFIDYYLVVVRESNPLEGYVFISEFLEFWYNDRKDSVTQTTLKNAVTSVRKFYEYLRDFSYIDRDTYDNIVNILKENTSFYLNKINNKNN